MKGYSLIRVHRPASDKVVMTAEVGSDSHWFSGHFPGDPILPGIAQLEMVLDAVCKLQRCPLRVTGVKKVRFKQIIRPETRMTITAAPRKNEISTYTFGIHVNGEQASSGLLTVAEV